MKLLNQDMSAAGTAVGNFQFSAVRPERLGATEYTLATVVTDVTGSVRPFAPQLVAMKRAVLAACAKSPRRDFLMLRSLEFNASMHEEHGFAELAMLNANTYQEPSPSGNTALYDATLNAIAATNEYAKTLSSQDFGVNGIVFVITDGDDNASVHGVREVKAELGRGVAAEWLESLSVVLIGVNAAQYQRALEAFKTSAGLSQYVDAGDATPEKLARLADFVSRSISSQSQSLGTGGASQALVF